MYMQISRVPAQITAATEKLVDILVHERKFALCFLKRLPTRGTRFSTHSNLARSQTSIDVILVYFVHRRLVFMGIIRVIKH